MARALTHSLPSDSLEAAVRTHFGLAQNELARYLGVSAGLVAHLEARRQRASPTVNKRLESLARLLPPPDGSGSPAPAFPVPALPAVPALVLPNFGSLPAGPLRRRHKQVLAQAARLRWELHRAGKGIVLQQRREWGVGVLQAALPYAGADAAEQAHLLGWLAGLAADVAAAAPSAEVAAGRALAVVRLLALDLEAGALARLLAAG